MKREILFRGKRIDTRKWIEGFPIIAEYDEIRAACIVGNWEHNPTTGFMYQSDIELIEVDPSTVGQFTGLVDKNEVKIFEGDVVTAKSKFLNGNDLNGSIEMNEFRASWSIQFGSYANNDLFKYVRNGGQCEIIGNIHDTPELKGGKQ